MKPSSWPRFYFTSAGPVFSVLVFALIPPPSEAATLSQYSFTGGSLVATQADTAHFTASSLTRGSTFSSPATFTTDWVYVSTATSPTSLGATAYFAITLTPLSGVTYSLNSLTFGTAYYTTNAATSGNVNFVVRSSEDTYTADLASYLNVAGQSNTTTPSFTARTVDLSTLSTGIDHSITFRIYVYDGGLTGGTRNSAIDDLIVNGTVAPVPEASTYAFMAGLIAVGFAVLRRGGRRCQARADHPV